MEASLFDGKELDVAVRQVTCAHEYITVAEALPDSDLLDPRFTIRPDLFANRLVARLQAKLLAFIPGVERISYPQDWWEAVKERWAPKWVLKRWPVKYHTYEARVVLKGLGSPLPAREQHPRFVYCTGPNP